MRKILIIRTKICSKCNRPFMSLKKYSKKICIDCYRGNHNLRENYPEEEIQEFLSTTKQEFIVGEDGKVFKVNTPLNCMEINIKEDKNGK